MATWINRILSLLVFGLYLPSAYASWGPDFAGKVLAGLILPMACIWWPEPIGDFAGGITVATPPALICAGGWLLLVGVPIIAFFLRKGMEVPT